MSELSLSVAANYFSPESWLIEGLVLLLIAEVIEGSQKHLSVESEGRLIGQEVGSD
jgi:hypothetical protein